MKRYLVGCDRCFLDEPGGSARIAWTLLQEMRARGHEVALVCEALGSKGAERVEVLDGVTVSRYRVPASSRWDPCRLRYASAAAKRAAQRLGRRWDVVHTHTPAAGWGVLSACGAQALRVATIHSPLIAEQRINWSHESWGWAKLLLGTPVLRRVERRMLRSCHRIVTLSKYTASELHKEHGESCAADVRVIPGWSAIRSSTRDKEAARADLGWPQRGFVALTLRRLVTRMGIDTLIAAAHEIAIGGGDVRVVVAGEGPELEHLRACARSGPGRDHIRFVGRLTDEQVALAYRACDVFVVPTLALECFGLIAVEALASGRPVIASRVGALPEVLEPVLPDLLFSPGDSRRLAQVLMSVRQRLSAYSEEDLRTYAAKRFGPDVSIARHCEALEDAPDNAR